MLTVGFGIISALSALMIAPPSQAANVPGVQGCVGATCDAPVEIPGVKGCVGLGCNPCDPSVWVEYERKKKTAEELFEAAAKQRAEVKEEAAKFYKEQLEGMGEVAAAKGPPLAMAGKLKHNGLVAMGKTGKDLAAKAAYLERSRAAAAVIEGAELGGAAGTALWIYTLAEKTRQLNAEWEANRKMAAEAARLLKEATDAFRAYGDQMKDCAKAREKQQAAEALKDRARELMETWDNNGNLYRDPSGNILDASAALKRAKEILSNSAAFDDRREPRARLVAQAPATPPDVTVTLDQLQRAIAAVDESIRLFTSGMDQLIAMHRAQENIDANLQRFLKTF